MFELFGLGRGWAGAFKADPFEERRKTAFPDTPISAGALTINEASAASATDSVRERFRAASGTLQAAFGGFLRETTLTSTTTRAGHRATAAVVAGISARVDAVGVDYFGLQASNEVNSRTSTVRTSASAIGLDVTTAEAASTLTSSGSLNLDVVGASSVKMSKEEMNTGVTTSYGSSSLAFTGSGAPSTSAGSLTGTYKGTGKAEDATSLQITVTKGGTLRQPGFIGLGQTKIEFEVHDQTGERIFSYSGNLAAGETVSLGSDIGLTIAFGEGELKAGHTASTTVSRTPITVDANAGFNAAPGARPQFEAVTAVTAGSFEVNDTIIEVYADDTINTVLDRINNSAAGVTAAVSGDKVTLTTKANSDQNIDIAGDTSGFVKAVRLDGASTAKGNLRDDERLLRDTTVFRDVRSGSFTINGRTIAVDKDHDTLATVLARINDSGAGVSASLNLSTNRIEIVTSSSSEELITVANDTTGLLGMTRLSTNNTVRGNIRDDRQMLAKTAQFAAVTSGSFSVNGVSISVNTATDSLSSVIDRINGSGAGVTASYDAGTDRVTFTPDVEGAILSIDSDTTGLLAAVNVASGTAATHANADAAFNTSGVNGPLLDPGRAVTAGSFTVNGVTIAVAANDTINTVLARISASSAGVTASYDDSTDRVTLTSKESGTPVALGGDSSGFLAAVKLDATATTSVSTVNYSSFNTSLSEMAEYASVTTGTLTVNGQDVAIDPMSTTITGLVDALNDLSGVSAAVDQTSGAIRIWSDAGRSLTLSDSSGVLDVLGLGAGTYSGRAASPATTATPTGESTTSNAAEVAANITSAIADLNETFGAVESGILKEPLEAAIGRLRDHGVRGLHAVDEDGQTALAVDTAELIDSLEAVADGAGLEKSVSAVLEALETDIAAAAGWNATAPAVRTLSLDSASGAQLMADQTASSLLYVRSSLQPQESAATTRKTVMKAYGTAS